MGTELKSDKQYTLVFYLAERLEWAVGILSKHLEERSHLERTDAWGCGLSPPDLAAHWMCARASHRALQVDIITMLITDKAKGLEQRPSG